MAQTVDETKDQPVGDDETLSVIDAVTTLRIEADDAKAERLRQNRRNRDAYYSRQDWSHKQKGQSTEFLPKVASSVEQMTSFIKKGLIQFGDWFSVDVDRSLERIITGDQIRAITMCFFNNLWAGNHNQTTLPIVISDGVKIGLLESLMIFKVHGGMMPTRIYKYDNETRELSWEESEEWRLRVDLVRPEDYYPDPSGAGLYEIHRVERDLHEVVGHAEQGVYDMEVVRQLIDTDFRRPEDEERTDEDRNQLEPTKPAFRKKVVLDEFWGTLLNRDGTIAHRNCVCTVANDRYLIRKPEPNPFWHQESPFVVTPLVRVPWSVWHRALYDQAAALNLSLNEMFNLMLDGGIAAVWGVKQIRLEDLEDPGQVAGGVQQGTTLAVKQTLPHNAKVLEDVSTGNVPQDAMAIFEFVNREFTQAALTNEIKLGTLPGKQVRATEIVEASQSQGVTLDGIVSDLESGALTALVRKAWMTILQNADDVPPESMRSIADSQAAHLIMRAKPEERFALFGGTCSFKVNGLSSTMAKALDFQKFMAALQAIMSNPYMLQRAMQDISVAKTIRKIFRMLNQNYGDIEKDEEERRAEAEEAARTAKAAQVTEGGGASAPGAAGSDGAPVGGEAGTAAQINQSMNPSTGLVPNA